MTNVATNKKEFKQLVGAYIKRAGIKDLMKWLEGTDFFESPASTKYHGSFEGGLAQHSLEVFYQLEDKMAYLVGENWASVYSHESVAIVALFHDLCKIGRYTLGTRNVPPNKTESGEWEVHESYNYAPNQFEMGHASLSLHYITKFMTLTDEEAQAIYWHMSSYDISPYSSLNGLSSAFENNPLAFMLAMSDMEATYVIDNEKFIYADGEDDGDDGEDEQDVDRDSESDESSESVDGDDEQGTDEVDSEPKSRATGGIRKPRKGKVEDTVEDIADEEPEEDDSEEDEDDNEEAVTLEEDFYYYDNENEVYGFIPKDTELTEEEYDAIYENETFEAVEKEEYDEAMEEEQEDDEEAEEGLGAYEEDFYFKDPNGEYGVIKAGEEVQEGDDELVEVKKAEYLKATKAKEVKGKKSTKAKTKTTEKTASKGSVKKPTVPKRPKAKK